MIITRVKFSICALGLIYVGYKLAQYGDIVAEKTGITKALMGFIFLSFATSLPEFVVSGSAVAIVGSHDLAFGDVSGTIIINLMCIAILDFVHGKGALLYKAGKGNILLAALTTILLTIISFSIFLRFHFDIIFGILGVGIESLLLIFIFVIGVNLIFQFERNRRTTNSVNL